MQDDHSRPLLVLLGAPQAEAHLATGQANVLSQQCLLWGGILELSNQVKEPPKHTQDDALKRPINLRHKPRVLLQT